LRDDRGMNPLSLMSAIASLVIVPVALGLGVRWLAGPEAGDAIPTLSILLTTESPERSGPAIREPEFVPWRLEMLPAGDAPIEPVLARPIVTRALPAHAKG